MVATKNGGPVDIHRVNTAPSNLLLNVHKQHNASQIIGTISYFLVYSLRQ